MKIAALALLVRHLHFFVVINPLPATPPHLHIQTRQFYTYIDDMAVEVYGENGDRLLRTQVPVGKTFDRKLPQPALPLYLVEVDPGLNGAIFNCDRPWGVMASEVHTLGVNGPGPIMYFFVPAACSEFTVGGQANSPHEGGRIIVTSNQGRQAAVLDGELDRPETAKIQVQPGEGDSIWRLEWRKPQTVKAALDDLNIWLDGKLTPLLFPDRDWAEKYGQTMYERDIAAREKTQ